MPIITIASIKGGVGKTTISTNLAVALAKKGSSVVVFDMDPQNAARYHLGLSADVEDGWANQKDWADCVQETESGVFCLPFGDITEKQRALLEKSLMERDNWIKDRLLKLSSEVWYIIDTPPGPSAYMKQALQAADLVIGLLAEDAASYVTVPAMEKLLKNYDVDPDCSYYLLNKSAPENELNRDIRAILTHQLSHRMTPVSIHLDQAVPESLAQNRTVAGYNETAQSAEDFDMLAQWIIELSES